MGIDSCPGTVAGHMSDGVGCSKVQREAPPTPMPSLQDLANAHQEKLAGNPEEPPLSQFQEWWKLIYEQGLQVVIGAILSAALGQAHSMASTVQERMPVSSGQGSHRMSSPVQVVASTEVSAKGYTAENI